MSWARLDDGFAEHPKIVGLSDRAFRLHVVAICFAARNLTDGDLAAASVRIVSAAADAAKKHIAELVAAGLWEPVSDGYRIHDFLDFNPSKAKVLEERSAAAERQRRWRERNGVTNGATDDARNGVTDGVTNGVSNAHPDPTRPDPGSGGSHLAPDGPQDVARASDEEEGFEDRSEELREIQERLGAALRGRT